MEVLARSGHFAQVVIADGNLPVGAMTGPNSTTVHLNFRPGLLDALTVLEGILEVCPIQGAIVMEKPAEAKESAPKPERKPRAVKPAKKEVETKKEETKEESSDKPEDKEKRKPNPRASKPGWKGDDYVPTKAELNNPNNPYYKGNKKSNQENGSKENKNSDKRNSDNKGSENRNNRNSENRNKDHS